jgi:hypothetical protein
VRDALNTKYSATVVGARGQAVRLFYKQTPHVDIAPAFAVTGGNGWVIPAGDRRWIQTDPFLHNRFLDRRNKELDGHLKPLIRLLKRWNAVHSRRFRSFHLEMVAQQCFASMSGSMRYGLRGFFNWAQSRLDVADPAGYSGNLAAVLNSLATSYERAQRAIEAEKGGKHSEAMRLWRVLLGNEFPAYG